jgi:VanZ family protein
VIAKKRILGILCILMTAGLLFVGLWPFDLSPTNTAYWLTDQEGLYFDGQHRRFKRSVGGMAYTPSPLSVPKPALSEKGCFTIEIRLRPAQDWTRGVPHIFSFIDSSGKELLYLGQWRQSLIVRWFTYDPSGKRWMKEVGVADALVKGKTRLLAIASNQESASIYVDGELVKHFQWTSLISEKTSVRGYSVILGNSRSAKSSWTGSVLDLRVYERVLSDREMAGDRKGAAEGAPDEGLIAAYAFEKKGGTLISDLSGNRNDLAVPERIAMTNEILSWPEWRNQKDSSPAEDIAVNILGFVPFGFLLAFWREQAQQSRRWRACVFAVAVGATISLVIEVTQAFIPARDSSMVDVICNTGGAVLGAGFLVLVSRWLGRLVTWVH